MRVTLSGTDSGLIFADKTFANRHAQKRESFLPRSIPAIRYILIFTFYKVFIAPPSYQSGPATAGQQRSTEFAEPCVPQLPVREFFFN